MGCAGAITLDKQEDCNRAPQKGRGSGRASERGPPGRAQQGQSAPGSAQRGRTGDAGRTARRLQARGQRRAPSSRAVRPGGALLRTRVPATTRASRAEHPQVAVHPPPLVEEAETKPAAGPGARRTEASDA